MVARLPRARGTSSAARELDEITLRRAQRGDEEACRSLVLAYSAPVAGLLGRMLGRAPRERVEDLAQETFLRVFRALPRFQPAGDARLSTWILTIATRLAIDVLRRDAPSRVPLLVPLSEADQQPSPSRADDRTRQRILGESIARAVEALPTFQRAVFILREYHELEYDDIAAIMSLDVGTVGSRLARARAALRAALAAEGVDV